jgi:homoserine O-acetyltransferase
MNRTLALLLALLVPLAAGCVTAKAPRANGAAMAEADSLDAVFKRTFTAYGFRLESGQMLPEMSLAYETYGRLAPDGRHAILITHGFTSSHQAAGRYSPGDAQPGWWGGLIGPGKTIDTNRYFVVSSNMLGSSYGSTASSSVNPLSG